MAFSLNHPKVQGINGTSRSRRRIVTPVSIGISDRYRDGLNGGKRVPRELDICGSLRLRLPVVGLHVV